MSPEHRNHVERAIYREAEDMVARGATAAEFSARFFGPQGRVRDLWNTEAEREAVTASDLYKWLQVSLSEIRKREVNAFEKEIAALSGRITIVVPKSLHMALKGEAAREGVSLAEIIRLKLNVPYRFITQLLAEPSMLPLPTFPDKRPVTKPSRRKSVKKLVHR